MTPLAQHTSPRTVSMYRTGEDGGVQSQRTNQNSLRALTVVYVVQVSVSP
jgi:hypothetical protein